jgi:hypothetical protein
MDAFLRTRDAAVVGMLSSLSRFHGKHDQAGE